MVLPSFGVAAVCTVSRARHIDRVVHWPTLRLLPSSEMYHEAAGGSGDEDEAAEASG